MLSSRNYPPPADLLPYIRHFYIIEANLPDSFEMEDMLLSENPFVRIILKGCWSAETSPGVWREMHGPLIFGSNSMPLPVRSKGPFTVASFAIRPSAWRALFRQPAVDFVDHVDYLQPCWAATSDMMADGLRAGMADEQMIEVMIAAIRAQLKAVGRMRTDEEMQQFEAMARLDSTIRIEAAAQRLGLSVRQMERRCMACYGLTPKAILRRSRFLDMAEAMRGFSTPGQRQLAELRYFDQSHLNREFHRFVGMTPGKFRKKVTPLLTMGLQLRVLGKDIS
jgi:AraC-like DNA-binding protein